MENLPGTLPGSSVILDTCGLRAAAGDVAAGCRAAIHNLKIIMMTIKILFMPESTEGVDQNQTTAMKNGR